MLTVPADLKQRLRKYSQEHVLTWWDKLDDHQRRQLLQQLERIDLEKLGELSARREEIFEVPAPERIAPVPVLRLDSDSRGARELGERSLREGGVAVILVAGGQGSRLGFEHPKGMYPIGPVSDHSLFQIHAEKVLGLKRRYGKPLPFLVMTSPINHEETQEFFRQNGYFGLPSEDVFFFEQGTMPALDRSTGKLLLESPDRLFTSPNGHGGVLLALEHAGLLDRLKEQGVQHLFYFQVDNPLVKVADPVFLGYHLQARAEVSSKIVSKKGPDDKLGNVVLIDGHCSMIEYSDMPKELASAKDASGYLRFWAGSPAIHFFELDFLIRIVRQGAGLPFHVARKKVPHLDENGKTVHPERENALKFEMFIFDILPRAERWAVVEARRREEFEPLKNASGPDSPETVRQAMSDLAADWLEKAHVRAPRRPDGGAAVPLEISPLFALDAEELAAKIPRDLRIDGATYLHEDGQ
jgi:UDP-N-acetylglucosamine/UDP-N-acetylgalactosamine diphosphorylase